MTTELPCVECATAGMAGFCPHRAPPPVDIDRTVTFCPSCFADEDGGSWNHTALDWGCQNCGNSSTVTLPKWAVNEIRRTAAWVGARYYPDDETKARQRELSALRKAIGRWPGRTVEAIEDDPTRWRVRQQGNGDAGFVWSETTVQREGDETAEQAMVRRADCDTSQTAWEAAPQWQRDSAVKGVEFARDNPTAPPSASHDSWLEEKRATGWKYGPAKNPETKEHPCFVPYEELPPEQRAKDALFQGVARALLSE